MSYEFAGTLYNTLTNYTDAATEMWLTADGNNSTAEVDESFATCTDTQLANEMLGDGWLDAQVNDDEHDVEVADIVAAFARLRTENAKMWQVVENAGTDDERTVREFRAYNEAHDWVSSHFATDERDELGIDILRDGSTEY